MTTACIIQARMGSTRFPGKVLHPLCGKPVLAHVIARCKLIVGVDVIAVAVPDEPRSEAIQDLADEFEIETIAGPENDVLLRYYKAATWLGRPKNIMRITADCPLLSPLVCSEVLTLHITKKSDYCSNVFPTRTYPKGLDCQVFTFDLLEAANKLATAPYDREHVCPWMEKTAGINIASVNQRRNDHDLDWCVDVPSDIAKIEAIIAEGRERIEHKPN